MVQSGDLVLNNVGVDTESVRRCHPHRRHRGMQQEQATVTLWRPTGAKELTLVAAGDHHAWPPRVVEQTIFSPVLSEAYATTIARDWNVPASGSGYVTRFSVARDFIDRYEVHQVGGQDILEYWIPAEDLDQLNASIVGSIEVVAEFHGVNRSQPPRATSSS
jgi:hypothetical protein